MIGDRLEIYTFEYLMNQTLAQVPDSLDKRQGSIIYDAIAPACYELSNFYLELRNTYKDTFATTAREEALDLRVSEQGITRYEATYAIKRADFLDSLGNPVEIPEGARFSTLSGPNPIIYQAITGFLENDEQVPGAYSLQCEEPGIIGNEYTGPLTNITYISGLDSATMTTLITPARDTETDEELRERYFNAIKNKPFGGNISQYRQEILAITGVGQIQVYPAWDGGGSVKCCIVDTQMNPVTSEFIEEVQQKIDPENSSGDRGDGLGLAPIGHVVTIATPEEVICNISSNVTISAEYTMDTIEPLIIEAVENYFEEVRSTWGRSDSLNNYYVNVYISKIISAILSVQGVINVSNTKINGSANDLELVETGLTQQIPVLGGVVINE